MTRPSIQTATAWSALRNDRLLVIILSNNQTAVAAFTREANEGETKQCK